MWTKTRTTTFGKAVRGFIAGFNDWRAFAVGGIASDTNAAKLIETAAA